MMNIAQHTSPSGKMASRPALSASQLALVLDSLMQLKWLTEDQASTDTAADVLDAIWCTQVRLLGESGRLTRAERIRLLGLLRDHAMESGERVAVLVTRIESALT